MMSRQEKVERRTAGLENTQKIVEAEAIVDASVEQQDRTCKMCNERSKQKDESSIKNC